MKAPNNPQTLKQVTDLIRFGLDNNLEIVSHGLAPNPWGFCFESHGKASEEVKQAFSKRLETLSKEQVELVKAMVF